MDGVSNPGVREHTEIRVLRAFYDAWVEFHSIPKDGTWRKRHQQLAAQRIVQAREAVMRFDALYSGASAGNGALVAPAESAPEILGN